MIKLLSLFSGIGAFEKALKNLNIEFELIYFCEINKYASKAYCLIHNENESKNLKDITKINIDELQDFDLITYGFPCQDISMAGKQKGFSENSNTRSSLLWNVLEIIKYKKPKYCIAENVSTLLQDKFKNDFEKLINYFQELNYNTYWKILNTKNYGIPQNRERIFIISIRKDIDDLSFEFPKKIKYRFTLQELLNYDNDIYIWTSQEGDKFKSMIKNCCPCLIRTHSNLKIETLKRRLFSFESLILQGFTNNDYMKIKDNISENQIFKLCGNSISVNVLEEIFKQLFLSNKKRKWLI